MHSKVSSDWLPSYIKATQPVLEIFKMAGYFPDRPRRRLTVCGADSMNIRSFVFSPHTHSYQNFRHLFYRNGINPVFISNLLRLCLCSIIISFPLTEIYKLTPLFVAIVTVCFYTVYVNITFVFLVCVLPCFCNYKQETQ